MRFLCNWHGRMALYVMACPRMQFWGPVAMYRLIGTAMRIGCRRGAMSRWDLQIALGSLGSALLG